MDNSNNDTSGNIESCSCYSTSGEYCYMWNRLIGIHLLLTDSLDLLPFSEPESLISQCFTVLGKNTSTFDVETDICAATAIGMCYNFQRYMNEWYNMNVSLCKPEPYL